MSDVVFDGMVFDRLREIGDQSERIASLESEIARLRLTDEEREAVECELGWIKDRNTKHANTLRKMLERLEGEQ